MPGWQAIYPEGFHPVLKMLLASLLYHEDYLRANCPRHPVFKSPVFAVPGFASRMKRYITAGVGQNKETKMQASGIPPLVQTQEELRQMRHRMDAIETNVSTKLDEVIQAVEAIPSSSSQVAVSELRGLIEEGNQRILQRVDERINSLQDAVATIQSAAVSVNGDNERSNGLANWNHGVINLPTSFEFPRNIDLQKLWLLWWVGESNANIPAYRMIRSSHLKKKDQGYRARAQAVIEYLLKFTSLQEVQQASPTELLVIFRGIAARAWGNLFPGKTPDELDVMRVGQRSYVTVYDKIKAAEKAERVRADERAQAQQGTLLAINN
jgi:ElaB/YqjD/DUF883 family membrane-anchored ribosome-binding protein